MPRSSDPNRDKELAEILLKSEKDRAENLMIVDLMRNDLSRVCRPHSVLTPVLCGLETYASVHHLVSAVTGRLCESKSLMDLIRAAFPGWFDHRRTQAPGDGNHHGDRARSARASIAARSASSASTAISTAISAFARYCFRGVRPCFRQAVASPPCRTLQPSIRKHSTRQHGSSPSLIRATRHDRDHRQLRFICLHGCSLFCWSLALKREWYATMRFQHWRSSGWEPKQSCCRPAPADHAKRGNP